MTSYLDSHRTSAIKPECYQVSKPEKELHMINIIYAALPKQKKRHLYAKTTNAKLYIYIGVGARDLYIDEAHTALDIFRFAAFFL